MSLISNLNKIFKMIATDVKDLRKEIKNLQQGSSDGDDSLKVETLIFKPDNVDIAIEFRRVDCQCFMFLYSSDGDRNKGWKYTTQPTIHTRMYAGYELTKDGEIITLPDKFFPNIHFNDRELRIYTENSYYSEDKNLIEVNIENQGSPARLTIDLKDKSIKLWIASMGGPGGPGGPGGSNSIDLEKESSRSKPVLVRWYV